MREFLLSIEVDSAAIDNKLNLVFLVSGSSGAPSWSSAKSSKASLKRSFTSSNNERDVYFSLTSLFNDFRGAKVVTGTGKASVESQVPGLMAANTNYYVHAYEDNGAFIKTSAPITTRNYPATYPAASNSSTDDRDYMWGMWGKDVGSASDPIVFPSIEMRNEEFYFLPLRAVLPTTSFQRCLPPPTVISIRSVTSGTSILHLSIPIANPVSMNIDPAARTGVLFRGSSSASPYIDVMYSIKAATGTNAPNVRTVVACFGQNPNPLESLRYTANTVITE